MSEAAERNALELARSAFDLARSGDVAGLQRILDLGLSPDARNERGDSLLMLASYHGRLDATALLLSRGASPDLANDAGQTPLAGASFKGDAAMARLLLDSGASADALLYLGPAATLTRDAADQSLYLDPQFVAEWNRTRTCCLPPEIVTIDPDKVLRENTGVPRRYDHPQ